MTERVQLGCIICPATTSRTFLVHMGGEGFFRFPLCHECWKVSYLAESYYQRQQAMKNLRGRGRVLIRQAWAEYIEPYHAMSLEFGPL